MKRMVFWLSTVTACLVLVGCGKKTSSSSKATNTVGENPVMAPVDYLGAIGKAQQKAVKVAAWAPLEEAIKMYKVQEGHYPKTLNDLVTSGVMDKLPNPPRE